MGTVLGAAGALARSSSEAARYRHSGRAGGQPAEPGTRQRSRATGPPGTVAEGYGIPEYLPVERSAGGLAGAADPASGSARGGWVRARLAPARHGTDPALVVCRAM